jgi:hypothetical protein
MSICAAKAPVPSCPRKTRARRGLGVGVDVLESAERQVRTARWAGTPQSGRRAYSARVSVEGEVEEVDLFDGDFMRGNGIRWHR